MRSLAWKSAMVVGVAALVLMAPSVAATISPRLPGLASANVQPDASNCVINITLSTAFAFSIDNDYCPTPVNQVTFNVLMTVSSNPHTFTLSPVANYTFSASNSTSDLQAFFTAHTPLVNIVPPANAGASNTTTIAAPAVGLYEAVCMEPGHFTAGMHVQIGIGVIPPSSGGGVVGIGAPALIIAGTIATLVVIALVLGFVIGRRRGPEEEMPPERLGYAEPLDAVEAPSTSPAEKAG